MAKKFQGLPSKKQPISNKNQNKKRYKKKKIAKSNSNNETLSSNDTINTKKLPSMIKKSSNTDKKGTARKRLEEYNKELKRIRQYKTKLEKEGYYFKKDPTPKSLTRASKKSLDRVKDITIGDIARKGISYYQKDYSKARARIVSAVKRAEKSGLTFNENVIPDKPPYITEKYVEYLKSIDIKSIKEKGVWLDEVTGEARTYEEWKEHRNKLASEKRQETKRLKELGLYEEPVKIQRGYDPLKEAIKDIKSQEIEQNNENDLLMKDNPFKPLDENVYTSFDKHVIREYRTYLTSLPPVFQEPLNKFLDNLLARYSEAEVAQGLENMDENIWDIYNRMTYTYEEAIREYTQILLDFIPNMDGDDTDYTINGVPLTKQIMKENVDFLVNHNIEEMENVL